MHARKKKKNRDMELVLRNFEEEGIELYILINLTITNPKTLYSETSFCKLTNPSCLNSKNRAILLFKIASWTIF